MYIFVFFCFLFAKNGKVCNNCRNKGFFMNSKNIKFDRKFNSKIKTFGIELVFIATIFFFEIGRSLFGELRHLVEFFYAKMSEYSVMSIVIPVKALFDITKLFSLVIFVFKIILAIIGNPMMLFVGLFTYCTVLFVCMCKKITNDKVVLINKQSFYKYQSKFLC